MPSISNKTYPLLKKIEIDSDTESSSDTELISEIDLISNIESIDSYDSTDDQFIQLINNCESEPECDETSILSKELNQSCNDTSSNPSSISEVSNCNPVVNHVLQKLSDEFKIDDELDTKQNCNSSKSEEKKDPYLSNNSDEEHSDGLNKMIDDFGSQEHSDSNFIENDAQEYPNHDLYQYDYPYQITNDALMKDQIGLTDFEHLGPNSLEEAQYIYYEPVLFQEPLKEKINVKKPVPNKFKTDLCRNWMNTGSCKFGKDCTYAHGQHELQSKPELPSNLYTNFWKAFNQKPYICAKGDQCSKLHLGLVEDELTSDGKIRLKENVPYTKRLEETHKHIDKRIKQLSNSQNIDITSGIVESKRLPIFAEITKEGFQEESTTSIPAGSVKKSSLNLKSRVFLMPPKKASGSAAQLPHGEQSK